MAKKVIIMGGGVAGMSAAHELIERGFEVQVFERKVNLPGGKARSVPVPDRLADQYDVNPEHQRLPFVGTRKGVEMTDSFYDNPLPGEHGFRFFPGFYKHVIDTMKRIPYAGNKNGVFDNLVPAPHVMIAQTDHEPLILPDRFPKTYADFKLLLDAMHADTGLTSEDKAFFADRVWQLMTSCRERRVNDYERIGWWQFTDGEHRSKAYQDILARGLTRTLVAARAQTASTKTGGDIFLQLIFNMANPEIATDRILDGPTNVRWLKPWLDYLLAKGVDYQFCADVERIDCENGVITGVWVAHEFNPPIKHTADYYICAMPVDITAPLLMADIMKPGQTMLEFVNDIIRNADLSDKERTILDIVTDEIQKAAIMKADPTLVGLVELSSDVSWMTGVQFFLNEEVNINKGHIIFSDSPWAITAISQLQFWKDFDISKCVDGKVKSIISVDVSEWHENGVLTKKHARDCTPEQIKDDVWEQMKMGLNTKDKEVLRDDMIHVWFIDRDIRFVGDYATKNTEPLLVNKVDTWRLRPESHCMIPNLFFAGDYVRTFTDLATMEGANESARRAVNDIIDASGADAPLCTIWDLHEPWSLSFYRNHDRKRYMKGLPWRQKFPWWVKLLHSIMQLFR